MLADYSAIQHDGSECIFFCLRTQANKATSHCWSHISTSSTYGLSDSKVVVLGKVVQSIGLLYMSGFPKKKTKKTWCSAIKQHSGWQRWLLGSFGGIEMFWQHLTDQSGFICGDLSLVMACLRQRSAIRGNKIGCEPREASIKDEDMVSTAGEIGDLFLFS